MRLLPMILAVLLISCREAAPVPAPKPSVTLFGVTSSARRVVIIADICPLTEFDSLRLFLRRAVEPLTPDRSFNLLFCDHHHDRCDLWTRELLPATEANKVRLLDFMEKVSSPAAHTGASPIDIAIKSRPEVIYLVDGGCLSEWPNLAADIREKNSAHLTRIHTIAVLPVPGGEKVMRQIARENGGTFKAVTMTDLLMDPKK